MDNKEIIIGDDAVNLIREVVVKLCDSVALTLGPKGRNAIIDTDYCEPFITNDGVTISKNLEFNKEEEVVAKIIKETSIKTCDLVGDGTTTSLVLLKSIYMEGLEYLKKGISPFKIKEEIDKSVALICNKLIINSKEASIESIGKIADTSSGNKEVGNLIMNAFSSIGENGKILVEESKKEFNELEVINGMFLDTGVVSSFMIKDRKKDELINNPLILVADYKINSIDEINNIINAVYSNNRNLVIIAESFDEDVIEDISIKKTNNIMNICAISAPNYSEKKSDILEDIAIYTEAKFISSKYGNKLEEIKMSDLGSSKNIRVTLENTIIYAENKNIDERVCYIKKLIKEEDNEFDKDILETRLANLSKGIAVIKVGAKTRSEMILNKMRIEDALGASKIALKYGYSPGGGLAFYNISKDLKSGSMGNEILCKALKMPITQILKNSNMDSEYIFKELKNKNKDIGFDALNNKYVDMFVSGIIDSTKVLIESLKTAASIATLLLTTDLIIVSNNKKIKENLTDVI